MFPGFSKPGSFQSASDEHDQATSFQDAAKKLSADDERCEKGNAEGVDGAKAN